MYFKDFCVPLPRPSAASSGYLAITGGNPPQIAVGLVYGQYIFGPGTAAWQSGAPTLATSLPSEYYKYTSWKENVKQK